MLGVHSNLQRSAELTVEPSETAEQAAPGAKHDEPCPKTSIWGRRAICVDLLFEYTLRRALAQIS
jgi:hypothetical protein